MSPLSQYKKYNKKKIEMFYDRANGYFRRIGRTNVYGSKIHRWEEICRERSGSVEERKFPFSHIIFFFASPPYHGIFLQNPKSFLFPGWLQITMDCNGRRDGPYSMAKRLITIAVTSTEENDDDDNEALVYVKELKKKKYEWLKDTLESETRDDTIIETLDTDCEIFKKIVDDINTIRCGKHVKNCALQNVFKIYNWWHQRHQK